MNATPRAEWARVGDRVVIAAGGVLVGVVERIVHAHHLPYARVRWENGHVGRHSLTQLRRK